LKRSPTCKAGLYDRIWSAFAVLLPARTVGVLGDGLTYEYVVGLRAVTLTDGMTADSYAFGMKVSARLRPRSSTTLQQHLAERLGA